MNPKAVVELLIGSKQVAELLKKSCHFIDRIRVIQHKNFFDKPSQIFPKLSKEEKELKGSFIERPADEFIFLHSSAIKAYLLNQRVFKAAKNKVFIYKRDESLSAISNFVVTRYPDLKEDLLEDEHNVLDSKNLSIEGIDETNYLCIVLGVGALRPHRAIPLAKWIHFIEYLLNTTDYKIKILGGPDEKDLSQEFEQILKRREELLKVPDYSRIENMIGKTSLVELAKILKSTERLFSCDTGILHIAAALGVPISSYFSITSEQRFGPFDKDAKVIRSEYCSCNQSSTNVPKHCKKPVNGYANCMWKVI